MGQKIDQFTESLRDGKVEDADEDVPARLDEVRGRRTTKGIRFGCELKDKESD